MVNKNRGGRKDGKVGNGTVATPKPKNQGGSNKRALEQDPNEDGPATKVWPCGID